MTRFEGICSSCCHARSGQKAGGRADALIQTRVWWKGGQGAFLYVFICVRDRQERERRPTTQGKRCQPGGRSGRHDWLHHRLGCVPYICLCVRLAAPRVCVVLFCVCFVCESMAHRPLICFYSLVFGCESHSPICVCLVPRLFPPSIHCFYRTQRSLSLCSQTAKATTSRFANNERKKDRHQNQNPNHSTALSFLHRFSYLGRRC